MASKTYPIRRLYHGLASVRSYVVHGVIKRGDNLRLVYKDKVMTLTTDQLVNKKFQIVKRNFKSLYSDKPYQLYDFRFVEDKNTEKQMEMFK